VPEFDLIDTFVSALPHARAPKGPGDDAAVLGELCVTTDALVEGVHFTRPPFTLADVGHKALATNLSDLAAMGAKPAWWLCALGLPRGFTARQLRELAAGMRPLARAHGLQLAGGNVSQSPVLSLTLTLAGHAKKPLLRSGARAGDLLYVVGWLGEAAAGRTLPAFAPAQRRPTPLVAEGLLAARFATAAIDVSDGLLQDLGHVLHASRVGARLEAARLPLRRELLRHRAALDWALRGGEDYALLLAVPGNRAAALERAWKSRTPLTRIGTFTRAPGLHLDGEPVEATGFQHF
jgi:thiamine-monophosphate kinase